jgi:hypothetical protein
LRRNWRQNCPAWTTQKGYIKKHPFCYDLGFAPVCYIYEQQEQVKNERDRTMVALRLTVTLRGTTIKILFFEIQSF